MNLHENRAISDWLARAHPLPAQARAEWSHHGIALLPLGRRFDAVRVPADRVHAAVGSDDPRTVAAALADWLHGPVIRDIRSGGRPYYVLVAPYADGDADWNGREERLGADTHLGVPRPGSLSMLAAWVVPPQHPGNLCDPAHLRALLSTADALRTVEP
ncbi:hypothetical protein ABT390_20125 [Streptomyces aurantiacus]|uniref:DNA primase/polymerase bifunctional N-terminal domain-containing protein n=1 Tax=Streptomyces aurantiacus JA 4570 TaxID=1286094 RepID=S3ZJE7_9ACTN|nr:hypothetical protein [Streptomyces aurantiacus]EPH43328.1 hypothetical protein STRAU_3614 [Streptomyces aurantiacus JA 4570]